MVTFVDITVRTKERNNNNKKNGIAFINFRGLGLWNFLGVSFRRIQSRLLEERACADQLSQIGQRKHNAELNLCLR